MRRNGKPGEFCAKILRVESVDLLRLDEADRVLVGRLKVPLGSRGHQVGAA